MTRPFAIDNAQVGALGGAAVADAAIAKWGADTPVQALVLTLPSGGQLQLERSGAAEKAIKDKLSNVTSTVGDTKLDANATRRVTADFLSAHPGENGVAVGSVLLPDRGERTAAPRRRGDRPAPPRCWIPMT